LLALILLFHSYWPSQIPFLT